MPKKITLMLSDETDKKLRAYIVKRYPEQPFGKLSEVVEAAITEYLNKKTT